MTDIRTGGLVREALVASLGEARAGGVVREALISGGTVATNIRVAGMAREVLLQSTSLTARQHAVAVVT
jgi:hypothetical protein